MRSFKDELLRELMRAAERDATERDAGARQPRRSVRALVAVVALSAVVGGAATAAVLSVDGGDTPLQTPSPVIRTTGPADREIAVDAYPARHGLCLSAREPNEPAGGSIACVNPSEPPYVGSRALGIALIQRRATGTTVLGLTSYATRTVEFRDGRGKLVSVPARELAPEISVSDRLRVVVADLPPSFVPVSAKALDARGRSLAVIELTVTAGG